jgi:DNA adenine methylase
MEEPSKKLRPVFCRIGSKRDIADRIIKLFPDGITTYVEPFVGSGAVLWKKIPHTTEVINDLDTGLIKDYKLLQSTRTRNFRTDLDTIPELQTFVKKKPLNEADKLTHAIVSRCNKFGSTEYHLTKGKVYKSSNPYVKLRNIDDYQARIKDVVITNMSYEKVIKKYDSPTTLFYCDPPYEIKDEKNLLYKHDNLNQEALRNTLATVQGKWLLSINDSPAIRRLYNGYYYIPFTVKQKAHYSIGSKPREELFIANYPISKRKLKETPKKVVGDGMPKGGGLLDLFA